MQSSKGSDDEEFDDGDDLEPIHEDDLLVVVPSRKATPPPEVDIIKSQINNKQRFPILTSKLFQQAITEFKLTNEEKESLIRNPNIHSVFQIQFNLDCPRLQQALKILNIQTHDLKVHEYSLKYDLSKKPLSNLVTYIKYITLQYNLLNDVLRTRNTIKRKEKINVKLLKSKDIRIMEKQQYSIQEQSTVENSRMLMLTEIPTSPQIPLIPSKFFKLLPSKHLKDEGSFVKDGSLRSLVHQSSFINKSQMSQDERKTVFDKKKEIEDRHYQKFLEINKSQILKTEYFYQDYLQQSNKVDLLRMQHVDSIKQKMSKSNERVTKVQQQNFIIKEQNLERHISRMDKIDEDIKKHTKKKGQVIKEQMQSLTEQKKLQDQLDEERDQRRHYYQNEEDKLINGIVDRLKVKSTKLKEYLNKKKKTEEFQKQEFQSNLKRKQQKALQNLKESENDTIKDYHDRQLNRQNQLQIYETRINMNKQDMSRRNLDQLLKVEKQQTEIEERQHDMLERQMETRAERIESVIMRHQSLIDIKKTKSVQRNQIRLQQSKFNYFKILLKQKKMHDRILQKNKDMTYRNEIHKQEDESLKQYKLEQLQNHSQK